MVNYPRWAMIVTVVVALLGVIYASPNFLLSADQAEHDASLLPTKQMNLGLDLQGGSSLLLDVDISSAIQEMLESVESSVRRELRPRGGKRIGYANLRVDGETVRFNVRDPADIDEARDRVAGIESGFELNVIGASFILSMSETARNERRQTVMEQAREIVGRRVNELGVTEPTIQQQGEERILVQVPGLDDPE
ncbi:MAG: protein translocase subunit SecD, partial [Alphaproteobacteria bacterium]